MPASTSPSCPTGWATTRWSRSLRRDRCRRSPTSSTAPASPSFPVWGVHGKLQIGPVITAGAPCFACFEARVRQHAVDLEAHDAIFEHWASAPPPPPTDALAAQAPLAAAELARILESPEECAGEVWRYDTDGRSNPGRVVARHRCPCRTGGRP